MGSRRRSAATRYSTKRRAAQNVFSVALPSLATVPDLIRQTAENSVGTTE